MPRVYLQLSASDPEIPKSCSVEQKNSPFLQKKKINVKLREEEQALQGGCPTWRIIPIGNWSYMVNNYHLGHVEGLRGLTNHGS